MATNCDSCGHRTNEVNYLHIYIFLGGVGECVPLCLDGEFLRVVGQGPVFVKFVKGENVVSGKAPCNE